MLALRKIAAAPGLWLDEISEPRAGPGDVLLEVMAAGICGTDLHIADWSGGYEAMAAAMPVTLGHEFVGRVRHFGEGTDGIAVGTRVVVRPSVVCRRCERCRAGRAEDCTTRTGIGIGRNGGFAALAAVPAENCVALPDELDDAVAALAEPMTVSTEAVDTGGVKPGDTVLVIGPGTIGQGAALAAEMAGAARVVVAGRNDAIRLAAVEALGFPETVDTAGTTLRAALARSGLPVSYDVIIEAAGAPAAVPEAIDLLALRGVLVICGIHPSPVPIDLTALVRRHQQIRGSYRSPLATWPRVIALMAAQQERIRRMISEEVPLSAGLDAFAKASRRAASKIVLRP
ncbi:zinc-binding dehydrogenase [Bosea sp. BIWAKO-01]|uniref:zinc-dependent alcohol dehydrogenase n=1 Tax=Bosea sp. BIWAKO-01 TaxID=506668 RepID=UPI0008529C18|nr:alcohol dehydrogenase catalytic domain-containing protein [Bosea sp. BIWAKO-01]GAU82475.1 L-threonine 3-dehydrogenase [Bosea sp. BIWAKO-01]